jgi:hypothetical protein
VRHVVESRGYRYVDKVRALRDRHGVVMCLHDMPWIGAPRDALGLN